MAKDTELGLKQNLIPIRGRQATCFTAVPLKFLIRKRDQHLLHETAVVSKAGADLTAPPREHELTVAKLVAQACPGTVRWSNV